MTLRRLLPVLLLTSVAGCDGMGGSAELGEEAPASFAVVGRVPQGGAAGVPLTASIEVTFTSNVDPASVGLGVLALNGSRFGSFTVQGPRLTFTPAGPLSPGTPYAVTLSPDIRGTNGHVLGPVPVWGFKTAGTPPPPPDTVKATPGLHPGPR